MNLSAENIVKNNDNTNNDEVCARLMKTDESEVTKNQDDVKTIRGKLLLQCLLVAATLLHAINGGMAVGYPAVLVPQLKSANDSFDIDDEKGSWIVSVLPAVHPPGLILSGLLSGRFGRKYTLHIYGITAIISWLFLVTSKSYSMILIGRVISGVSGGLGIVAGQIYIAEISGTTMRAVLNAISVATYIFGVMLIYTLGLIMHWRLIAGLSMILPALYVAVLFLFPESPVWLVRQEHVEKAIKSYAWLHRSNSTEAKQAIEQLISRTEKEKQSHHRQQPVWSTLKSPSVIKPFLIVTTFNFLYNLSGVYLLMVYPVEIISETHISNVKLLSVIAAGVRFVFIVVACFLLTFLGRRTIGLYSGFATAASALVLATVLQFNLDENGYFVTACLLLYIAASTTGIFLLPTIMMGELFPAKARGLLSSSSYTIYSLFTFGSAKLFPVLRITLHISGLFWLFGISSLLASVLIYLMLPETKGKTLDEIEDYFSQKNMLWISRNHKSKDVIGGAAIPLNCSQ